MQLGFLVVEVQSPKSNVGARTTTIRNGIEDEDDDEDEHDWGLEVFPPPGGSGKG